MLWYYSYTRVLHVLNKLLSSGSSHAHGLYLILFFSVTFLLYALLMLFGNDAGLSLQSGTIPPRYPEDDLTPANSFYANTPYDTSVTNSSLNFGKLVYINVAQRYDRDDFMVLQSSVSNIRPEQYIGVDAETLDVKGLPPSEKSYDGKMSYGAKACFRSHATVWRRMLFGDYTGERGWEENESGFAALDRLAKGGEGPRSIFVMEADATWDINITNSMYNFGRGLEQFLNKRGVLKKGEHATADDPWLSEHWDVIQMSGCYIQNNDIESYQYVDPISPATQTETDPNHEYWDWSVGSPNRGFFRLGTQVVQPGHRMIRHRSAEACSAGYAISRRGALKILSKTSSHLRGPVDLIIKNMVWQKDLDTYSAYPIIVSQWQYVGGLGVSSKNSDIRTIADEKDSFTEAEEKDSTLTTEEYEKQKEKHMALKKLWHIIHRKMYLWQTVQDQESRFIKPALEHMRYSIF